MTAPRTARRDVRHGKLTSRAAAVPPITTSSAVGCRNDLQVAAAGHVRGRDDDAMTENEATGTDEITPHAHYAPFLSADQWRCQRIGGADDVRRAATAA